MYLPNVRSGRGTAKQQVVQFGGINYTQNQREGELAQSSGVSSRMWPCLTTRTGRTEDPATFQVKDMFAWEDLVTVDGTTLRYGGRGVGTVTAGRKQFAVVHTKLCIFPDKKYLDLETLKMGNLQTSITSQRTEEAPARFSGDRLELQGKETALNSYTFTLATVNINVWENLLFRVYRLEDLGWTADGGWRYAPYEEKGPRQLKAGDCLMLPKRGQRADVGALPDHNFYGNNDYAEEYDQWGDFLMVTKDMAPPWSPAFQCEVPVEKHNAADLNPSLEGIFAPGDRVTISGCVVQPENDREKLQVVKVEGRSLTFCMPEGAEFQTALETGDVTICREVPDLDFICESGGRLWGVSSADNQIYASAQGDPANFYAFVDGVTGAYMNGSWGAKVGTAGPWTACVAYGSDVLCWKEDGLHKVLGTHSGNFEVFDYQTDGVQRGGEKSLVTVNETLFYKGRDGVYAYTGGTPRCVSGKLDPVRYTQAAAGTDGRNYYISMKRTDTGQWECLSYSFETGLWMVEDSREVTAYANVDGGLYELSGETVSQRGGQAERVPWSVTFVPIAEMLHNKKGYARLLLYLELEPGAWMEVDVAADGGAFRTVWTARAEDSPAMVVPIRPGRCHCFQIRLRGEGGFVLKSMVREFKVGGDGR